jgi:bacillithiol system protein YtxJ
LKWIEIKSELDLNKVIENSFQCEFGVAIFKHSTRCSISSVAKMRLTSFWDFEEKLPLYYLDLITYRNISDLIAKKFDVMHESPQLIVLKNGTHIYDSSHMEISVKNLRTALEIKN